MRSWRGVIIPLALSAVAMTLPGLVNAAEASASGGSVVELTRPGVRNLGPRGDDHSGRVRQGMAGLMTGRLNGERQASGLRFDPSGGVAASSVLPLGTTVRVTNLENGRIAMVQVQDLAPRGSNRLLDLSPASARALGLRGEAKVQVAPLAVPQRDGTILMGDGSGLSGRMAAAAVSARPDE